MTIIIKRFAISVIMILIISSVSVATGDNQPQITVVNGNYNFGFIPIDYDFIHYFKVTNTGMADLKIEKLQPNCDCTTAYTKDTILAPGDTADIKIHFNTLNYYGPTTRHITVYTNDPKNPTIQLNYASNIGFFPELFQIKPIALFFLPGNENKTIDITNKYTKDIEFAIEMEQDSLVSVDKYDGELKNNQPFTITVSPRNDIPKGTHYSNISIKFISNEGIARVTVPIKIVRF